MAETSAPRPRATGDERLEVPPPPFSEGIFPCSACHADHEGQPHAPGPDRHARRHRAHARRAAPLVPRLPRRRRPRLAAPGERRAGAVRASRTGCAASATARSCATGGPACTGGAPATGTATRATCSAPTATTRTSRASSRSRRSRRPRGPPARPGRGARDDGHDRRRERRARAAARRSSSRARPAAAAGFLLTACGPKRLVRDAEGAAARRRSRELERRVRARRYGTTVTVADTPAHARASQFAYALDISRCIGCRRCVYACVEENNQSRDPQIHWIRVLAMEKEKGVDFTHADPYYDPAQVPEEGHFYVPGRLPAVPKPAVHEGVPDGRHLDGAGRHRRHRLRLVHRLPLLHGGLPVRRAPLQLGASRRSRRPSSTRTRTSSATGRARRASSRSAPSASSGRATGRYPACVEVCPVGRAEVRQPPRSGERDPLHHRAQARPRAEGGAQHRAQVLLLLRDVRPRVSTVRLFSRFVRGQPAARPPRATRPTGPGSAFLAGADRLRRARLRRPGPGRASSSPPCATRSAGASTSATSRSWSASPPPPSCW